MTRQQEKLILRLWRDWCKLWPEQYAHASVQVREAGYDPVFDVIPSQAYKDFYYEVVRDHPLLRGCNPFEVIDAALNQTPAPEAPPANEPATVASVELPHEPKRTTTRTDIPAVDDEVSQAG